MCGIAGVIDWERPMAQDMRVYAAIQSQLARRGPDQEGIYICERAALIHRRLSVVDLEGGRQPMLLEKDGRTLALVYNGELYNTGEVRAALSALGHHFRDHSDTEVLLHAYAEWGEACLDRLNGIFAFAVWDEAAGQLFLARDRMGVKPLFYARTRTGLVFASEIKALLAHPQVEPVIDEQSIAELMLIGPGRTPGYGVFKGIDELKPGACGRFSRDGLRLETYWSLRDRAHTDTFEQTVARVRELVLDAIQRQMASDVPVGTFLSGGLDSSIISAVAAQYLRERGVELNTFSVAYRGNDRYFKASKFQPNSDDAYIERMRQHIGSRHHRVELDTDELVDALYEAVDARDLPGMADVDSSLLLFCRQIKPHVTVALSGECADEIFGGYPWYRDPEILAREGFPWAQSTMYRAGFLAREWAARIDPAAYVDERYRAAIEKSDILPGADADERRMKQMVNLNMDWFMQTLLDRKDRMSMYSGLEVRVPFCDHRIAEYLYGVPWAFKDHCGHEKGLLREAVRGLLPDDVLWRKKSPYPKTHNPDYLVAVSARLRAVIEDPGAPFLLRIVRQDALESLMKADNPVPWYGQLMTTPQTIAYFVQLDHWLRQYRCGSREEADRGAD